MRGRLQDMFPENVLGIIRDQTSRKGMFFNTMENAIPTNPPFFSFFSIEYNVMCHF